MFDQLEMAPPDAILGLTEAFKLDPRPEKINLGVGVYTDSTGATPILQCVKQAEERLLREEKTKNYLPITGSPAYAKSVQELLFTAASPIVGGKRAATAQTPGGTGGLRVAGDFLRKLRTGASLWLSDPTWANHAGIFQAAGLEVRHYPYYNHDTKSLDFDRMLEALNAVPVEDVVLFHGACHNPSGMDPDQAQWRQLAGLAVKRGFLPLFDFAYQGFGDGIAEDAQGLRFFAEQCPELFIVCSFSKNFGLYNERVGALTAIASSAEGADKAFSHIKTVIRANYSNPPAHGGAIVATILGEPELRRLWEEEVTGMRERINGLRKLFVDTLAAKGVDRDFSFITRQKGMFSFAGLNKAQVDRLREEFAIYIVGSGRISVAGMNEGNMDRLCEALAAVL